MSMILIREVFPTHVGVFLAEKDRQRREERLPHTCGGVSASRPCPHTRTRSSPHTWGCFRMTAARPKEAAVFPTHVGVFLSFYGICTAIACLPHTRGGVSSSEPPPVYPTWSSPHTWGCFIVITILFGKQLFRGKPDYSSAGKTTIPSAKPDQNPGEKELLS